MLFYKIDAEERNPLFHRASLPFEGWLFFHFLTFPETSIKILRKLSNYNLDTKQRKGVHLWKRE